MSDGKIIKQYIIQIGNRARNITGINLCNEEINRMQQYQKIIEKNFDKRIKEHEDLYKICLNARFNCNNLFWIDDLDFNFSDYRMHEKILDKEIEIYLKNIEKEYPLFHSQCIKFINYSFAVLNAMCDNKILDLVYEGKSYEFPSLYDPLITKLKEIKKEVLIFKTD